MFRLILLSLGVLCCVATTDLNKHELRYVADHLTRKECRELFEALEMKKFELDHKVTGEDAADVPCIVLLQYYDKVSGRKDSFQVRERE